MSWLTGLLSYLVGAVVTASVTFLAFWYTELVGPRKRLRSAIFSVSAGLAWPILAVGAVYAAWMRFRATV